MFVVCNNHKTLQVAFRKVDNHGWLAWLPDKTIASAFKTHLTTAIHNALADNPLRSSQPIYRIDESTLNILSEGHVKLFSSVKSTVLATA